MRILKWYISAICIIVVSMCVSCKSIGPASPTKVNKKRGYGDDNSAGKCLFGDCKNGFGLLLFKAYPLYGVYAGEFKNGDYSGYGTEYRYITVYNMHKSVYEDGDYIPDEDPPKTSTRRSGFQTIGRSASELANFNGLDRFFKDKGLKEPSQVGCVEGDCANGWGTYIWKNESRSAYLGLWKNNRPVGFGIVFYSNGHFYIGELNDNADYHGTGYLYTGEDGFRYTGDFANSQITNGTAEKTGKVIYYGKAGEEQAAAMAKYNATHAPGKTCQKCRGTKIYPGPAICPRCDGKGHIREWEYHASNQIKKIEKNHDSTTIYYTPAGSQVSSGVCPVCFGTGHANETCSECKGRGFY
jgi:hypothetical protein